MTDSGPALGAMKLLGESFRLVLGNFALLFPLALAPALLVEAMLVAVMPAQSPTPGEMFGAGALFASLAPAAAALLLAGPRTALGPREAPASFNPSPTIITRAPSS